jgi:hypothetical protein
MPRPDSDKYELTDAEKRDLTKLIKEGKPLPEKYRFILFEDKREVELVWNGKSREVSTAILPFQTLEHIDEPRKEKHDDEEFSFDTRGRQLKGWTNKLIWGDNKLILSSLKSKLIKLNVKTMVRLRKRNQKTGPFPTQRTKMQPSTHTTGNNSALVMKFMCANSTSAIASLRFVKAATAAI